MLQILDIKKSFGELHVLRGVDLDVEQGDVVAIIGPSGSGKTTLLRCINFLEKADSGTLIFDNEKFEFDKITKKEIARLRRKIRSGQQDDRFMPGDGIGDPRDRALHAGQ